MSIKLLLCFSIVISLYLGGILTYLFEESYIYFKYPPFDIKDIRGLADKIELYEVKEYGSFEPPVYTNSDSQIGKITKRTVSGYDAVVKAIDQLKKDGVLSSKISPLTQFRGLDFLIDVNTSCTKQWQSNALSIYRPSTIYRNYITIVIIVKSAVNYFERRDSIRRTWYLNRTVGSYSFKTVFMVGSCDRMNPVPARLLKSRNLIEWTPEDCKRAIAEESKVYGDIIQSSGIDSYYNNTVKTFMTLRWIHERCPSDFFLAIDDDYVFELNNFIEYVETIASDYLPPKVSRNYSRVIVEDKDIRKMRSLNITNSGNTLEQPNSSFEDRDQTASSTQVDPLSRFPASQDDYIIALQRLAKEYFWSGYLLEYVKPLRSYFSKWYISRANYPYDRYPNYLTGGMHLMSLKTARHLYYGTYFTKSFIFDDVYLGIIAARIHIDAINNQEFKCSIEEYLAQKPLSPNATRCCGVHDISAKSLIDLWDVRERISNGTLVDFDTMTLL